MSKLTIEEKAEIDRKIRENDLNEYKKALSPIYKTYASWNYVEKC